MKKRTIYAVFGIVSALFIIGILAFALKGERAHEEAETDSGFPPPQPTMVSATPGVEQITLSWQPVDGVKSYNIYWSTQSPVSRADSEKITWSGTRYSHTGLDGDMTYYYIVAAVNAFGEGPPCTEVSAVAQPPYQAPEVPPQAELEEAPSTQQLEVEFHKELMERLMSSERPRGESPDTGEQTWFPEDEVPPPWDEWPDAGEPTWNPNEDVPPPREEWPGEGETPKWSPHDEPQRPEAPF